MSHAIQPLNLDPSVAVGPRPVPPALRPRLADRRPSLLLALRGLDQPTGTLQRAYALARVLDLELHLLCVQRGNAPIRPLFPDRDAAEAMGTIQRTLAAAESTAEWARRVLGGELPEDRLEVKSGNFLDQVVQRAHELEPELLVLGPDQPKLGALVTKLVRRCQTPVLVARPATAHESILAATDLQDANVPVLRQAAALGRRLQAPVVALHNVAPVVTLVAGGGVWPVAAVETSETSEARRQHLQEVSALLPGETEAVVGVEPSATEAILKEARDRDADLIVVGTHGGSWFNRFLGGNVAQQVVDRAQRSVLVTPLAAPERVGLVGVPAS